jgi:formate C-acetyltransferase
LLKAVELALTGGKDLLPFTDLLTGKTTPPARVGPDTGDATKFKTWESFWNAYAEQTRYIVRKCVELYEMSERVRARFSPTPYLSCLVGGCAEKGLDVTQGGAELSFTTIEGVTFATTVDSLLAVKYLVFDKKECTMAELIQALKDNWVGHEVLQAKARNRAPKYGRDDDYADEMARRVMDLWTEETWKHTTKSTGRRFRPECSPGTTGWVTALSWRRAPTAGLRDSSCPTPSARPTGPTSTARRPTPTRSARRWAAKTRTEATGRTT